MAKVFEQGETIEYAGKAVVHLAADTNIMAKSGKIINTADVGREFGFVDTNGKSPIDFRLSILGNENIFNDNILCRQVKVLVAY